MSCKRWAELIYNERTTFALIEEYNTTLKDNISHILQLFFHLIMEGKHF